MVYHDRDNNAFKFHVGIQQIKLFDIPALVTIDTEAFVGRTLPAHFLRYVARLRNAT